MKAGFLSGASLREKPKAAPPLVNGKRNEEHFVKERFCGDGNFCEVFEVTEITTGFPYALKVFEKSQIKKSGREKDVLMEKHCMQKLNNPGHPNVVRMVETFSNENHMCILYEFCRDGELWKFVNRFGGVKNKEMAQNIFYQILEGTEYIHSKNLAHRDLKLENVLVQGSRLKICDLATAVDLDDLQRQGSGNKTRGPKGKILHHYVGTANFLPPEAIRNERSDKSTDLWALGGVLYQILTGKPPFEDKSEYLTYCRILEKALVLPTFFPEDAMDLIERCFEKEPEKRISIVEMKKHRFFDGYDPEKRFDFYTQSGKHVEFEIDLLDVREKSEDPFLAGRYVPVPADEDLSQTDSSSDEEN